MKSAPGLSLFDLKHIRGCCINFPLYKCFYSVVPRGRSCANFFHSGQHTLGHYVTVNESQCPMQKKALALFLSHNAFFNIVENKTKKIEACDMSRQGTL